MTAGDPDLIDVRFYAELRELLPRAHQHGRIRHRLIPTQSVKDLIESYGVPHTEVDVVLADGESVDLGYLPRAGERIAVYPVFESFDIRPLIRLRPKPLREPRFVLDGHLGTLTRRLRLLGFDCEYSRDASDAELVDKSLAEHRILLTRDRGLLRRKAVTHGYLLRSDRPEDQVLEVVRRFQLSAAIEPFTRCPVCNAALVSVAKADIEDRLPPLTRRHYDEFRSCPRCGRDYWRGAHHRQLADFVARARSAETVDRKG